MKIKWTSWLVPLLCGVVAIFLILTRTLFFRVDMTAENRYSLSEASRGLISQMQQPLTMKLYLGGELDANLLKLRHAVVDMVSEINMYSNERIAVEIINPNEALTDEERYEAYAKLEQRGLNGMSVSVRGRGGRMMEQVIFPWAELCSASDSIAICLMQPNSQMQGEAIVNSAVEDLEYQIVDAIRVLNRTTVKKVAFIEGHNELREEQVYDASDALSRYFQIDRGVLGSDASILDDYDAIVVAHPTEPFSESDKFIIDQYIMRGGSVLWLVDGARISNENLSDGGLSPMMAYELNLNDMLFKYGVRITPSIIEDMQCAYMPVNISRPGETPRFEPIPWFYNPLLQPSPVHVATKNIDAVKADFASGIEIVGDTVGVRKEILLLSSNASHVTFAPAEIDVAQAATVAPEEYFNTAYIPVAVSLSGKFNSLFTHRMPPEGMVCGSIVERSVENKMIVVADGDVIKNELQREGQQLLVVPLGYDRVTQQTHGNKDFIVNSLLYLTDDEGVMELRKRQLSLRLLNRAVIESQRTKWILINTLAPLALLAIFGAIFIYLRHRKYSKF